MTLAIIGTRTPTIDYDKWVRLLLSHIDVSKVTQIVSGGARGIDSYGRRFARKYQIPITIFQPEYSKYGRAAPLVRNIDIVRIADLVIAFPSINSRGTYHAIREAKKRNIPVIEINISTSLPM